MIVATEGTMDRQFVWIDYEVIIISLNHLGMPNFNIIKRFFYLDTLSVPAGKQQPFDG